jgi:hypothetical protein
MGEELSNDSSQNNIEGQPTEQLLPTDNKTNPELADNAENSDSSQQTPDESVAEGVETNNDIPTNEESSAEEPPIHLASIEHPENEGRTDDVLKDWDKAIAGDPYRSKAAANRKMHQRKNELTKESYGLYRIPEPKKPVLLHPYDTFRGYRRFGRRYETILAENDELNLRRDDEDYEALKHGAEDIDLLSGETRAAFYDKRAERVEAWAGILHDHPISQTYMESHKGVDLSPDGLVRLEELNQRLAERNQQDNELAEDEAEDTIKLGETPEYLAYMLEAADRVTYDDYQRIQSELATVLADKAQLIKKLYKAANIDPTNNQIALSQALLEDIKSGRASQ